MAVLATRDEDGFAMKMAALKWTTTCGLEDSADQCPD